MLNVVSGVPGAGKTLFTLATVEEMRRREPHREVYAWNVDGLNKPEWKVLENGKEWHLLPAGSIVIMDEAQSLFRVRSKASEVPPHVAAFETHRHEGLDVFLITQHPTMIDPHVRKLAGKHYHVKRAMGTQVATIYEWLNRVVDPNSKHEYKDVRSRKWKYPSEVFGWYKSAEIHNVKRDLPWRQLVTIALLAACVIAGIWWVFADYGKQVKPKTDGPPSSAAPVRSPSFSASSGRVRSDNPWASELRHPRIAGLEMSAPQYDVLQQVRSQPSITGCIQLVFGDGNVRCECYSAQSTVLDMSTRQCMDIVRKGWFDPTLPPANQKEENIARLNARDSQPGVVGVSSLAGSSAKKGGASAPVNSSAF